ncbi:hypothetical protein BT96DRAFT_1026833 [Gymnopus androsaceus JB14]|uniref:Uncharacterized protein n=1 Tax=Gymnopus androsaceus JB14 TaxID=1447944 RepID=A0A6A4GGR9_9AGAR|nr:hypothetical protein BT96DRAFT_1026833 [Gymnopus androsaceus JB14]
MCYVIITSKGFRCGASTGQMDADGALAQMAVRPAAGSTNARKYCRYENQLQRLYRQYVEATQQNPQAMGYPAPVLDRDQWLAVTHKMECNILNYYHAFQQCEFDCEFDDYGNTRCPTIRGTPHKYRGAPGGEPMPVGHLRHPYSDARYRNVPLGRQ